MARDYVNRRATPARQARKKGGLPGWVWAIAGLSLGLCIAAFVYLSRTTPGPAPVETPAAPVAKSQKKKEVELPPETPARFSFYEMLPSYEVVIPSEPKPTKNGKTPEPAIAGPGEYLIQVGSFRQRVEAESQKAKLALIGIESRVEQITIDNKDTWFRVRIGPEKDEAKVKALMGRLQENGVKTYLVRVKS